jgi:transcriptional regulator with XRE-family HTH domain
LDIVHPVSSSQLAEIPDRVRSFGGDNTAIAAQEVGFTQVALAAALGITFQQLQKYERAINRISAGAMYQLSVTLEVPVRYFF